MAHGGISNFPGQDYPTISPQTTPFTSTEIVAIRRFAGYTAWAAFGYLFTTNMANLDMQIINMNDDEQAVIRTVYLAVLPGLETAILTAATNLGTDIAAVWTRNRTEIADRQALYNHKRREMCAFIGVAPGPSLQGGGKVLRG